MNTRGALYVEDSGNSKIIGSLKADATYASIAASCPNSCALKAHGCYAIVLRRGRALSAAENWLDRALEKASAR